jgi:mediator of RNA polymerase II transcription subunit 5
MDMGDGTVASNPNVDRDGDPTSSRSQWARYLTQCINSRLDSDEFDSYVPLLYNKHPLPPVAIADICLRPQPSNHESLDPRISRYLEVLTRRELVDTASILSGLYKYSTSQMYLHSSGAGDQDRDQDLPLRWASSYTPEEVLFYRLSKAVRLGVGVKTTSQALGICVLMARWMTMFTTAAAAFAQDVMGQLQSSSREEMEAARAAFVMLLLSICENPIALRGLSRPAAKGAALFSPVLILDSN